MNAGDISATVLPWIKTVEPSPEEKDENGALIAEDVLTLPFAGDLVIAFAVDTGEYFELLQRGDLPPGMDAESLLAVARENMAEQVEFNLTGTSFGGFGLLAGGEHEAAALCLDFIWDYCAQAIGKNLVIAVPARDSLFMAEADDPEQIAGLKTIAENVFLHSDVPLTRTLFLFSAAAREFSVFGAV